MAGCTLGLAGTFFWVLPVQQRKTTTMMSSDGQFGRRYIFERCHDLQYIFNFFGFQQIKIDSL